MRYVLNGPLRDYINNRGTDETKPKLTETFLIPGFHLPQTPRPRHKKQSDYMVEQSSFPLIALFWLINGRCRGRNWLYGNQA